MRWVRLARALIKPLIVLTNELLGLNERVKRWLMRTNYKLVRADMNLAAKVTLRELRGLMRRLSEGSLCGYAEELGLGSDEIIDVLRREGCVVMRIIDFDDMINYDTVLGCPRLRREVTVKSSTKIREWVCVSWWEEEEERLMYAGEPEVIYVDDDENQFA